MSIAFGFALIIVGLAIVIFGHRSLPLRETGLIGTFTLPPGRVRLVKWAAGFLCICFGAALVLRWRW